MTQQGQGDVVQAMISTEQLRLWIEWARRDNANDLFVPSDIRVMLGEISRLRTLLSSSREAQGWRPIDENTPKDTHVILAAQSANGWAVGEAFLQSANEDGEYVWWWADAPPGEYHSDDVIGMGATPMAWQALPSAPGSVPTSLAGQVPDIIPMGRENDGDKHVTAYMCLVDFECEVGLASGGNIVYPSIEECREGKKCVAGCGIVEVEIRATRVVQEPSDDCDVIVTAAEIEAQSSPQPTAGGDAPDIAFKSELKRRGYHNPMNAVLAENIIAARDKWIGAGMIDAALSKVLSAERARVIAQIEALVKAKWQAAYDNMEHAVSNEFKTAFDMRQAAIANILDDIRALGQQDTGGAG